MPCWYPHGRRVRGSLTREAPVCQGLASRQGFLFLIVPEGAATRHSRACGIFTIHRCRCSDHLCCLYLDYCYLGILICLFHCFVLLFLLNYDFLTIHNIETLCGLADALTLQVVELTLNF